MYLPRHFAIEERALLFDLMERLPAGRFATYGRRG